MYPLSSSAIERGMPGYPMTLTELQYLVALDQERHFGRAAVLCNVSQPALSSSINKLEKELEVILFERSRSAVRPTALGQRIIAHARQVVASTTLIRDLASAGNDHMDSPLVVGAVYDTAPYLLPQCVLHLHRMDSTLVLRIQEGHTAELIDRLNNGELDAAIVSAPPAIDNIASQALFDEPYVGLLPHPHPLCVQPYIKRQDLALHRILLPEYDCGARNDILQTYPELQTYNRPDQWKADGNQTLEMLRHLILSGFGFAVIPLSAAIAIKAGQPALAIRPLADPAPKRRIHLMWRLSFPRHRAIDALRETVIACKPAESFHYTGIASEGGGLIVDNQYW